MPVAQNHRFVRIEYPVIQCYGCEAPLVALGFADLLGPRQSHYCQACATKAGMKTADPMVEPAVDLVVK